MVTCMLIDDDPDEYLIFQEALLEADVNSHLIVARDVHEALELSVGADHLDYIFLDMSMRELSIRECMDEIQNAERLKNVPLIIYSTSWQFSDIQLCQRFGAEHYLIKSNSISRLSAVLCRLFMHEDLPFLLNAYDEEGV